MADLDISAGQTIRIRTTNPSAKGVEDLKRSHPGTYSEVPAADPREDHPRAAASFNVWIQKAESSERQEVEVTPETTVGNLKEKHGLKSYGCRFKGAWKNASTMADLRVKAGETIHFCKTGLQKLCAKRSRAHSPQTP